VSVPAGPTAALLDLRIEAADGARNVRCDLIWEGELLATLRARLAELGLEQGSGPRRDPYAPQRDPARGGAPTALVDLLVSAVASHLPSGLPLGLRFGQPSGALPFLPWERWLTLALDRPILRRPYLPSRAAAAGSLLEIALCGSVPRAKDEFELTNLIVAAIAALRAEAPPARFHLFVDGEREGELKALLAAEIAAGQVVVVPAAQAASYGVARRRGAVPEDDEPSAAVTCPWLRWMLATTPPRLDVVQFLCHGFLSNGRGHLAFAESPLRNSDTEWSRFVGWRELVTFLDTCGARALVLSSPPDNWSVSGLYALADQVARARPGPAVVHDFAADPGASPRR
jgi:hypothetical protein